MRVELFVNPRSRRGRRLGSVVRAELARRGVEFAERGVDPAAIDAIVVAGGDGTFSRYIVRALELDVPIGLVPLGTFNDLARTLGIPPEVGAACAVIACGHTRRIDVARVNGFHYVSEASVGVSSRITKLQKTGDKQRLGFGAVALSALQAFRFTRPFHAEILFDGNRERLKTVQLTVANSDHFGGFITVDDAAIDDGWLDLYAVEGEGIVPLVRVAAALAAGRGRGARGLHAYRSKAFFVDTRRPHSITADGEPAGTTPARFEVVPAALRVFVPPPATE